MTLGAPQKKSARLGVLPIALALVLAAFLGAAAGLIWQDDGLGDAENEGEKILTSEASEAS